MTGRNVRVRAAGRRFVAERLVGPAQAFVNIEAASGIALLAAALAALLWANSPWDGSYADLWNARLALDFNRFAIDEDVRHLVNDGLMTIFFFVVSLEIKRELVHGELSSRRKAALPIAAAIGGMAVPAALYAVLNAGGDGARGWGIPMATDIAFSLGVLALLGRRIPLGLKVFLLALAIVDDLGAIIVIAVFYTDSLEWAPLAWAAVVIAAILIANRSGVRSVDLYVGLGILLWLAVLESGIHATLAGVALAAMTPSRPLYAREGFHEGALRLLAVIERARGAGDGDAEQAGLQELERLTRDSESQLDRLERTLQPWSSFLVVPVFALANAGLNLSGGLVSDAAGSPITIGIVLGLVAGKLAGVAGASWLMVRIGVASLPAGVRWGQVVGVALLAGIGFTVSLFITGLAFEPGSAQEAEAKAGVFAASLVAGVAGYLYLRWVSRRA